MLLREAMELVWERTTLVCSLIPVSAHCTILWETVWVNKISKSGFPILLRISPQGLQKTLDLQPCFLQISAYFLSMHSFPPIITTLMLPPRCLMAFSAGIRRTESRGCGFCPAIRWVCTAICKRMHEKSNINSIFHTSSMMPAAFRVTYLIVIRYN